MEMVAAASLGLVGRLLSAERFDIHLHEAA